MAFRQRLAMVSQAVITFILFRAPEESRAVSKRIEETSIMKKLFVNFFSFAIALLIGPAVSLPYPALQESGQPASGQHQGPGGQSQGDRPGQSDQQSQGQGHSDQAGTLTRHRKAQKVRKNNGKAKGEGRSAK
jgi:hypothetical protein